MKFNLICTFLIALVSVAPSRAAKMPEKLAEVKALFAEEAKKSQVYPLDDRGTTPFRGEKMTAYKGGVRVLSMLLWPGVIRPGQMLNGIQGHQDMVTSLATAAGVPDVAVKMEAENKQYIDGVNNLPYWKGESPESARNHIFHYYEGKLMAVRMGPWKVHFSTKENYDADIASRSAPLLFNIRMDQMEFYDNKDSYGHMLQKNSWVFAPMGELMGKHLMTLGEYPPVQGGKSFDIERRAGVHQQGEAVTLEHSALGNRGSGGFTSQAPRFPRFAPIQNV
jgi:hypothetical protein